MSLLGVFFRTRGIVNRFSVVTFRKICFIAGACLMIVNIVGLTMSLRNPNIYSEQCNAFSTADIIFKEREALNQCKRRLEESNEEYSIRLNKVVNQAVAHYWLDAGIDKYHIRVPIWENFILYILSYFHKRLLKYQFFDHTKALERGVGMCGQQACIVVGFLRQEDLDARIVGLDGHTVATVEVEHGEWHILDPDYGVYMSFGLNKIVKSPVVVLPYYQEALKNVPWSMEFKQKHLIEVVKWYGPEGNEIDETGMYNYLCYRYILLEKVAYIGKWLVPIALLISPFSRFKHLRYKRSKA